MWRVISGSDAGKEITLSSSISADKILTIEEPQFRVSRIQLNDDGSCSMRSVDSVKDRARSVFEPPLPLCPKQLRAAAPFEGKSKMRVEQIATSAEQDKGLATRSIAIEGSARITTELGTFDCTVVSVHFRCAIRFAKIEHTVTIWIAPKLGPVAEQTKEKIAILGLIPRNFERLMVKISDNF